MKFPTWKTAHLSGRGRLAKPVEITGLQAHHVLHHHAAFQWALDTPNEQLAYEHSLAHANGFRHGALVPALPERD